jgi:pimeloyl-ACP methyl ester carboxylesterase
MTAEQFIADTLAVTDYLRDRFGKDKIYLMAHSGGTFIGLQAAARAPQAYGAYIGVAQMVRQWSQLRAADRVPAAVSCSCLCASASLAGEDRWLRPGPADRRSGQSR